MIEILEDIIFELKDIPGLGFLRGIREGIMIKRTQMQKRMDALNTQRNNLSTGARRLKSLTKKGSKRRDD